MNWRLLLPPLLGLLFLAGAYLLLTHQPTAGPPAQPAGAAEPDDAATAKDAVGTVRGAQAADDRTRVTRARLLLRDAQRLSAWIDIEVDGSSSLERETCAALLSAERRRLDGLDPIAASVARDCAPAPLPPIPAGVDGTFGLWQELTAASIADAPQAEVRLHQVTITADQASCRKLLHKTRSRRGQARLQAAGQRRRFLQAAIRKQSAKASAACAEDPQGEACSRSRRLVELLRDRLARPPSRDRDPFTPDPDLTCRPL
jgi:hypothetical protein